MHKVYNETTHAIFFKIFRMSLIHIKRHSLKSGPDTRDPGNVRSKTLRPETWDPGALGPRETGPRHPGPWNWDPDTQDLVTGSLRLGTCDSETQNPERRTLRIELVTQILSISTQRTD